MPLLNLKAPTQGTRFGYLLWVPALGTGSVGPRLSPEPSLPGPGRIR